MRADTASLRVALAAPALGSAVVVIPAFMLSDLGVPLNEGGPAVVIAVLALSAAVLAMRRPSVPRPASPVAAIALLHLCLVGRPMARFGFHWLANANGDMGYYVLSATSLLTAGLRDPVDRIALAHHHYATVANQLHEIGTRVGADVVLSSLAATTGRFSADLYMPLTLSVSMVGVCAAGALAMQFASRARAAIVAAAILAVSPMATYGVVQQLLPQVWGLALAAALIAFLMRPELHARERPPLPELVAVWVLAVALFLVYIELAASLLIAYGLYLAYLALQRRLTLAGFLRLWVPTAVALVIVANAYLPRTIDFVTTSARAGVAGFGGLRLFARAIVPTAVPAIVGLQNLFAPLSTRFMSLSIVVGMLLLAAVLAAAIVTARKGIAACIVIVGDVILGVVLAAEKSDFGLFKLYMYVQPFFAAAVGVWVAGLRTRFADIRSARVGVLVLAVLAAAVAAAQLATQATYVSQSMHPTDLRHASDADLLPAFRSILARAKSPVISLTDNVPLTSLEGAAASVQPHPVEFLAGNPFGLPSTTRTFHAGKPDGRVTFGQSRQALAFLARNDCVLALSSGSQQVLNRRQLPEGMPDIVPRACSKARDVLAFVVSSVGQTFYSPKKNLVSFWQLEGDPAFPGRTMSGFGRYALLEEINPTPGARLELDFSTSSLRDPSLSFRLPDASVVGAGRFDLPVTGLGSARVFSPPLRPQMIDGHPYVLLDMGKQGFFPPVRRNDFTGLWGSSIHLDPRRITSDVRNVSLVSARGYRSITPPASIGTFPKDLGNRNLEYSGIFEDGWVGRDAYVFLSGRHASQFALKADVAPAVGQRLTVTIDGKPVWSKPVAPGALDIRLPVAEHSRKALVRLHWAVANRLSEQDPRPAPARLQFLGFASASASLVHVPADLSRPGVRTDGVAADGWLSKRSDIVLAGGREGNFFLHADVPPTPGELQSVRVTVNGKVVASRSVSPGRLAVAATVPAASGSRTVRIEWARTRRLGPNDPRRAAALLVDVGFVPIAAPRRIAIPADLSRRDLGVSGVYGDGWARDRAAVVLAGGPAATLEVVAQTPFPGQRVRVFVDDRLVAAKNVPRGLATLRVRLPASPSSRHVQLRFTRTARIAANDARRAATLLESFALSPEPR